MYTLVNTCIYIYKCIYAVCGGVRVRLLLAERVATVPALPQRPRAGITGLYIFLSLSYLSLTHTPTISLSMRKREREGEGVEGCLSMKE